MNSKEKQNKAIVAGYPTFSTVVDILAVLYEFHPSQTVQKKTMQDKRKKIRDN